MSLSAYSQGCGQPDAVSPRTATVDGATIKYESRTGFLPITARDGKNQACLFFTAYTRSNSGKRNSARPIIFGMNGGPTNASLLLHMGLLGPQRLDLGDDGLAPYNPPRRTTNDSFLIDMADIVLLDPVGTGFSHAETSSDEKSFFGAGNDSYSLARAIEAFVSDYGVGNAPRYLIAESYGGTRAAQIAHFLQKNDHFELSGLVLLSPFLTTATVLYDDPGNDLPYVLSLTSYSLAAQYHHRLSSQYQSMSSQELISDVQDFSMRDYATALALGNSLPPREHDELRRRMSDFTGLPEDFIEKHNLRIGEDLFEANLLASEGKAIGRLDTRQTAVIGADSPDVTLMSAYNSAFKDYLASELNFPSSLAYVPSRGLFPEMWPLDTAVGEFSALDDLSQAMIENPALKVFFAGGYYDLAIPYEVTLYHLNHLSPRLTGSPRIATSFFPTGHMIYSSAAALLELTAELRTFLVN